MIEDTWLSKNKHDILETCKLHLLIIIVAWAAFIVWVALQFRKYAMAVWQCGSCVCDTGKVPFPFRHWFFCHLRYFKNNECNRTLLCATGTWLTSNREEKRAIWKQFLQFREEKEKSEFHFPGFEKRKRNQIKYYQLSRRERDRYFLCSSFEKRNFK